MMPLDSWRQELRGLIPRGFLRRDQAPNAVFASDYPRFPGAESVTCALLRAGYRVTIGPGVAHIDGTEEKYAALFSALPDFFPPPTDETLAAWSLARRLLRQNEPLRPQTLPALGWLMKRLDAGDSGALADFSAFTALCQRKRQPVPAAAGKIIFCYLSRLKGGQTPC